MTAGRSGIFCWSLLSVCFLLLSADQKNILAESGENVILPCRATNHFKSIDVVKWSRADLEPEYVLLYRDGHFERHEQHPSFKNRVELQDRQMKDGDVSLILMDVTTDDAGKYECRVFMDEPQSLELICTIYLSVVDPPGQTGGRIGLITGLYLPAVFIIANVVLLFLIYRKHKKTKLQSSYSV